ncbi:MAG: DUF2723 domain-containing protein [Terrimicrobiaceae bacterium]|nr:DUF2723 domain-containing protein [Terrimicrobiaceae bacterium]
MKTAAAAAVLWGLLIAAAWSPRPYWPDADGYTSHIAEGRWVAHPPGYPFFVAMGRAFHFAGLPPYEASQAASLVLCAAGVGVLFLVVRRVAGARSAAYAAGGVAFSWVVLLLAQTGTSHAADLLAVSLLLGALLRLSEPGARFAAAGLFAALLLFAGFRLNTLIMMGPALAVAAWFHRSNWKFWVACALAAAAVLGLQQWVVAQSGGAAEYTAYARAMHRANSASSLLLSGPTPAAFVNLARCGLWYVLAAAPLLALLAWGIRGGLRVGGAALAYGLASAAGVLAVTGLYLCTHPGYIAGALPGTALAAAAVWRGRSWPGAAAAMLAAGPVLFLALRPIEPVRSPREAAANGLLLQYGAASSRKSLFLTTSAWLVEAGFEDRVPAHRLEDLRQEAERKRAR